MFPWHPKFRHANHSEDLDYCRLSCTYAFGGQELTVADPMKLQPVWMSLIMWFAAKSIAIIIAAVRD
jgi:hypothetical protein